MEHDRFTPVVPARHLTAAEARPGDRVAVNLNLDDEGDQGGTYPFEVVACESDGENVELELRELATPEPRSGRTSVPAGQVLAALAVHFGRCADCGRLSPCPDELAERRLERLWHDAPEEQWGATAVEAAALAGPRP